MVDQPPDEGRQRQLDEARSFLQAPQPSQGQLDADRASRLAQARALLNGTTMDELAAETVGQENIDASDSPAGLRALMSVFGDTFEEKQAAFDMFVPAGDLVKVPVSGELLYRRAPDEQFRKVDPGFFEMFDKGFGAFMKEAGADIADIAGDTPEILGETAGLLIARRPGAGQFFGDLTRMGVGAAIGEAFQQGLQTATGTQKQTGQEQRGMISGSVFESVIGGTIGAGLGAGVNVVRGRSLGGVTREGAEAIRAAERIDTKPILPQQVSDLPFVRLLSRQAQTLLPRIQRYLTEQERRTALAVRSMIDPEQSASARTVISNAFERSNNDFIALAKSLGRVRGTEAQKAGQGLKEGFNRWWKTSGSDVDNLYNLARAVEAPDFDITQLQVAATTIMEGVQAAGTRVTKESSSPIPVQLRDLDPKLANLLGDIREMSPDMKIVNGISPTDQLRELRKRASDISIAPAGQRQDQSQLLAGQISATIKNVLESTRNTNPEFVAAWKTATGAASKRFTTREHVAVVDLARTQRPAQLAERLAKPGQIDNLEVLKDIIPKEEWDQFGDFFKTSLLRDPQNMKAALDSFDEPTLNLILNETDRTVMRKAATQINGLKAPKVQELFERQTTARSFIQGLFVNQDSARFTALGDLVKKSGGNDSELGKTVRSALIDEIWDRGKVLEKGIERIDFNKLTRALDEFDRLGALDLLDPKELRVLRDAQIVQDFSRASADAGTSMQSASAAADIRVGKWTAISTFFENYTTGRFVTSELGRRVLIGKGLGPADTRFYRAFGAIAADISTSAESQQDLGVGFERLVRSQ